MNEIVQSALINLCEALSTYQNRNKRIIAARYLDAPAPADNVDYYQKISSPRSLNTVKRALADYRYTSPQQVYTDLKLVFFNGQEYHNKSSEVWRDAAKLVDAVDECWQVHEKVLGPSSAMQVPEMRSGSADGSPESKSPKKRRTAGGYSNPETDAIHAEYIRNGMFQSSDLGTPSSPNASGLMNATMDEEPSGSASRADAPDLAALLQMAQDKAAGLLPPDTPASEHMGSSSRVQTPGLATPPAVSNSKGKGRAEPRRPATARRSASVNLGSGDGEDEESAPRLGKHENRALDEDSGWLRQTNLPYPSQGQILSDIFSKIKNARDPATGRSYSTWILRPPPQTTAPLYYSKIREPITLEIIEARLIGNQYQSTEQFDQDLTKLFADARRWMDRSNEIQFGDLLTLQKIYQDVTRVDGLTPADSVEQSVTSSKSKGSAADVILLQSINFKGEVLQVGDWIHLYNEGAPAKCIPAQIFKLYKKKDSQQRGMTVNWYLRPEETIHPLARLFYENEVFKAHNTTEHNVEDVMERCLVMYVPRHAKGRPQGWNPETPTYLCDNRYKDKNFKKIKNWATCVPEEVKAREATDPLDPQYASVSTKRVKSPFLTQVTQQAPATKQPLKKQASSASNLVAQQQPIRTANMPPQLQIYAAAGGSQLADQGARPVQIAAQGDQFHPLPEELASHFRCDPSTGELLWFTAPPAPQVIPRAPPLHTLEYLEYLASLGQSSEQVLGGRKRGLVEVLEDFAEGMGRASFQ